MTPYSNSTSGNPLIFSSFLTPPKKYIILIVKANPTMEDIVDSSLAVLTALRELATEQGGAIESSPSGPIQFVRSEPLAFIHRMSNHLPGVDPIGLGPLVSEGRSELIAQGFLIEDEGAGGAWVDLARSLPAS